MMILHHWGFALRSGRNSLALPAWSHYKKFYACKSRNKNFSSFQALGSHRASCHYKSKSIFPTLQTDGGFKEEAVHWSINGPSVETYKQSLCTENKKVRVNECLVCHRSSPSFHLAKLWAVTKGLISLPLLLICIHSTTEQKQFSPPSRTETWDLNMPAENANDCTQLQHSSAVSVNLGADSTSWPPYDHQLVAYNSSPAWWMENHQPGLVVREDEADSKLGSNNGSVRGQDLGYKRDGA